MNRARFIGCCVLITLAVNFPWGTCAQGARFDEWQEQRETLRGIDELWVKVRIGISLEGPTRQRLQSDVEQALQRLPIRIVPEHGGASFDTPALIVEVAMVKTGPSSFAYCATARLHRLVRLDHNPQHPIYAATWRASSLGDGDLQNIRNTIHRLINRFIEDFRAVNGR